MNSMAFIRDAKKLIVSINDLNVQSTFLPPEEKAAVTRRIQQDIDSLFSSMTNPSLPSAYQLAKVASNNGYRVDNKVHNRIAQFD
jgi:hypothetical protein